MKIKLTRPIAIGLTTAMIVSAVGASAYALNNMNVAREETQASTILNAVTENGELKDENVYVLTDSTGVMKKVIISESLLNDKGETEFPDSTEVEVSKEELPVTFDVSYELDGKRVTASELAGKSGRVKIRFDYRNNQYQTVKIDGKEERLCVPFVVMTGLLLDNDTFSDITVSNGKLINDGTRTAVVGLAFPGLQGNLNIARETIDLPESVEITANVKNFALGNTVTIAANDVFSNLNTDKLDTYDDLKDACDQLVSSLNQLIDGSSELYDGICTLLEKSGSLVAGANRLAAGALQLQTGAAKLDAGASNLSDGAQELANGLGKVDSQSAKLNAGAKQVFDTLLNTADSQIAAAGLELPKLTIENYASVLDQAIASLSPEAIAAQGQQKAYETVAALVNAQRPTIKAGVTAAVKEQVTANVTSNVQAGVRTQVIATLNMTPEEYDAAVAAGAVSEEQQKAINDAVATQMQSAQTLAIINSNVEAQMQSEDIQALIEQQTNEQVTAQINKNLASGDIQEQIKQAQEAAAKGAASLTALKGQLDSYMEFYTGIQQYTAGVGTAKQGADKLSKGSKDLKNGASELHTGVNSLNDGIQTINNSAPALVDGVSQLRDGAMQLSDGLKRFKTEGVEKLIDAVDGKLGGLMARVRATVDVSRSYRSFVGTASDDSIVNFIYRTDAIDAE